MAVKRPTVRPSANPQNSIWTTENELKLFKAALKYKPAGVIRHFNMALIHNELVKSGMKDVTPGMIWDQLSLLFNLEAVDNIEKRAPLNLESSEAEFSLPKKDFHDLMSDVKKLDHSSEDFKAAEEVVVKKTNPPPVPAVVIETPKLSTPKSSTPKSSSKRPDPKRPTRSTPVSASSAKRRK